MKLLKAFGLAIGTLVGVTTFSLLIAGLIALISELTVVAGMSLGVVTLVALMTWAFYEDL